MRADFQIFRFSDRTCCKPHKPDFQICRCIPNGIPTPVSLKCYRVTVLKHRQRNALTEGTDNAQHARQAHGISAHTPEQGTRHGAREAAYTRCQRTGGAKGTSGGFLERTTPSDTQAEYLRRLNADHERKHRNEHRTFDHDLRRGECPVHATVA